MTIQADRQRLMDNFMTLARMDAESFHEENVAAWIKAALASMGFDVYEDEAGARYGAAAGNVYGILKGNPGRRPVLFSAHMDTVKPGLGKVPVIRDGRIESAGDTVLGADDLCGIVEILEGIRLAKERSAAGDAPAPGDIEVLFTIAEEVYGKGAAVFDYSKITAKDAYVLDMSGAPGSAARKAPSIVSFEAVVRGKAAHAGFVPEAGIHALAAAAKAIAQIPQGHVSETATFNIGTMEAGTADNIVPEHCRVTGEARSFLHEEALALVQNARETFAKEARGISAHLDFKEIVRIKAYETPVEAEVCREFKQACEELGLQGELKSTHGGSDNNVFAQQGIRGIVISNGMYETHSTTEYAQIDDIVCGAELVAALIQER